MLVKLYEKNTNSKEIERICKVLSDGGVIIYPTDTVYAIGCDLHNQKAFERVARLKNIDFRKANFTIICSDLSHLSTYAKPLNNSTFKLIKRNIPGPFTFILEANNEVPKIFGNRKKTIGIRIPDNEIIRNIVKAYGSPLLSTSIHDEDTILEYSTDPELIHDRYEKLVDLVIDGGFGGNEISTILDCTQDDYIMVRQGKGILDQ